MQVPLPLRAQPYHNPTREVVAAIDSFFLILCPKKLVVLNVSEPNKIQPYLYMSYIMFSYKFFSNRIIKI